MSNPDEIVKFVKEEYVQLLDDFIHIIDKHNDSIQLEKIFEIMVEKYDMEHCQILNCSMAIRHQRDRRKDNQEQMILFDGSRLDSEYVFYRDLMDQIHCYLYHLYDTGLRVKIDYDEKQQNIMHESDVDYTFLKIKQVVHQTKVAIKQSNRFNDKKYESNKFSLSSFNHNQIGIYVYVLMTGIHFTLYCKYFVMMIIRQ